MKDLLSHAFDPEAFRRQGHQIVDLLSDHLGEMLNKSDENKVLNYVPPNEMYARWVEDFENLPAPGNQPFFETILHDIIRLHHPKYLGHQTSGVAPPAALAELVGCLLDPGMGVYEQGTSGVVLERLLSKKMGELIGWPDDCEGFFTSGGTLGNLTALLCARQVMIPDDVWKNGYGGKQYAFLVSSEAHYSVARAVQVMGMGSRGVVRVPVDSHFRMRTDLLDSCFEKANSEGITIIGVVSSSCSTATGSHDDIEAIAAFCEAKKIWLHVDGAHGGCALFSKKHRHRLRGVEKADSFIVDFHKMLLTPKLITSVIFKNGEHSYQTFAQKASYLWDQDEEQEWYNLGKRTFELTKSFMSIRVYAIWRKYGTALFEQNVDRLYGLGKTFAGLVDQASDFEVLLPEPETNIVCFRFLSDKKLDDARLDKLNAELRMRLVQDGEYFIVQTRVSGKLYLRCTLMNPFTTEKEIKGLLDKLRALAN